MPLLRINVKLGGINLIPDPQDASFLTDPVNPTMVMGRILFASEP
jgi:eukaryotic translation initiation factor 2C